MKRIQCLPDLCLLMIFDGVPLDDLTRIGRVCQRWYLLEKSAFKRRHHLSLFIYRQRHQFRQDSVQLKCIRNSTTQKVIDLFPNVTSLTIENEIYGIYGQPNADSVDPIALANLFTHRWSSKLVSLQLLMPLSDVDIITPTIIDAINSLSSLKRLWLDCIICDTDFKPQFPIIAQLEEFYLKTSSDIEPIEWLLKYAEGNTALSRIEIDTTGEVVTEVESLLKLSPQLAAKFINLYPDITYCFEYNNLQLTQFCSHFTSLEAIKIVQCIGESTFAERLTCLSPLKQLNSLTLFFHTVDKIENPVKVEPFETVNRLKLAFSEYGHRTVQFMNSFNFVYLFPKVECVTMLCSFDDENDDGNVESSDDDHNSANRFQQLRKIHIEKKTHFERMIEPLKKCECLREIEYNTKEYAETWTR